MQSQDSRLDAGRCNRSLQPHRQGAFQQTIARQAAKINLLHTRDRVRFGAASKVDARQVLPDDVRWDIPGADDESRNTLASRSARAGSLARVAVASWFSKNVRRKSDRRLLEPPLFVGIRRVWRWRSRPSRRVGIVLRQLTGAAHPERSPAPVEVNARGGYDFT